MRLSKTDFLICQDCAKNAWLKIHRPEIYRKKELSSFDLNIIETGNEIDKLSRDLFPDGVLIESRDDSKRTSKLIKEKTPVIYQPVFETEKYLAVADILVFNQETEKYDLYEVKSSTASEENGGRNIKDYLIDIAFQKNVLDDLGVEIGKTNLIRLNKEYVRHGKIELEKLFLIEDLTEGVNENGSFQGT